RPWKSISAETTYAEDLTDIGKMRGQLAELASEVCESMQKKNLLARAVTIKVRYSDFTTVTRSHTSDPATRDPAAFTDRARALLDRTDAARRPVRLLGVGAHGLEEESAGYPEQLLLR